MVKFPEMSGAVFAPDISGSAALSRDQSHVSGGAEQRSVKGTGVEFALWA
jgi:hypothetical protein